MGVVAIARSISSWSPGIVEKVYHIFDKPRREDNPFVNRVRSEYPLQFESVLGRLLDEGVLSYAEEGQIVQSGKLNTYLDSTTSAPPNHAADSDLEPDITINGLKSEYFDRIKSGEKTIEVRKSRGSKEVGQVARLVKGYNSDYGSVLRRIVDIEEKMPSEVTDAELEAITVDRSWLEGYSEGGSVVLFYLEDVEEYSDFSGDVADGTTLEFLDKFDFDRGDWEKVSDPCQLDADLTVLEYYHRQINPPAEYVNLLEDLGLDLSTETHPRGKVIGDIIGLVKFEHVFDMFVHDDADEVKPARVFYPKIKGGYYNPAVRSKSCRSAGSRSVSNLRRLSGAGKVVYLRLTFPSEVDRMMYDDPYEVEEKCWTAYKMFFDRIGWSSHGSLGYSGNFHGWSSANPFEPNCHFHSPIIWSAERNGHLYSLPDYGGQGKPVDLDEAKSVWAEVINEVFGLDYLETYEDGVSWVHRLAGAKSVNVHVNFVPLSDRKRLIHKEKYRRRSPLVDLSRYIRENGVPEVVNEKYLNYLVDYTNRSRPHGFWTKLNRYQKRMCSVCGEKFRDLASAQAHTPLCGLEWDGRKKRLYRLGLLDLKDLNENRDFPIVLANVQRSCPVCGDPVAKVSGFESLPKDGVRVFLSRHGGIWKRAPPDSGSVEWLEGSISERFSRLVRDGSPLEAGGD